MKSFPRIILPILAVIAALVFFIWSYRVPSDHRIQEQFFKDKPFITELLTKFTKESPNIVGVTKDDVMLTDTSNWVQPERAGFSMEHFAEYKALMDQAHIIQLFRSDDGIHFAIAGVGFASEGWRLDFTYTKIAPSPLVQSIDSPPRQSSENRGLIYRPLGDDWYIRLIY